MFTVPFTSPWHTTTALRLAPATSLRTEEESGGRPAMGRGPRHADGDDGEA